MDGSDTTDPVAPAPVLPASPRPTYSPTDIGFAIVNLLLIAVDVLSYFGVIPHLDDAARASLSTSLTVIVSVITAAYVANRLGKHLVGAG